MMKLDFTSALYLGMEHPTNQLVTWEKITTGIPAILQESSETQRLAQLVANLQGYNKGLAYSSTLHLFWDIFECISKKNIVVFIDKAAYPIAKWGAERVFLKGIPNIVFSPRQLPDLRKKIRQVSKMGKRPILISDGWLTSVGMPAPIANYLKLLKLFNGLLILDDTQSLGLLGARPTKLQPFGKNGGGILPWLDIKHPNILIGSSLAKGFGAPLAVLTGDSLLLKQIKKQSKIRLHCSPPSIAAAHSGLNAILINHKKGNYLRQILWRKIQLFKKGLYPTSFTLKGGIFPIQTIRNVQGKKAILLHRYLADKNIKAVLVQGENNLPLVSFLFSANHTEKAIKVLIKTLRDFEKQYFCPSKKCHYVFLR